MDITRILLVAILVFSIQILWNTKNKAALLKEMREELRTIRLSLTPPPDPKYPSAK